VIREPWYPRMGHSKHEQIAQTTEKTGVDELMARDFENPVELFRILKRAWAGDTASPTEGWSASNPAKNHCSVTSLLFNDCFGGTILVTRTAGGNHFYNCVDGKRWDLTVSQFAEPIAYDDTLSSRAAAMADTSPEKYSMLSRKVQALSVEGDFNSRKS